MLLAKINSPIPFPSKLTSFVLALNSIHPKAIGISELPTKSYPQAPIPLQNSPRSYSQAPQPSQHSMTTNLPSPALYPACAPSSALELGTAPASAQAVTIQGTPTADQVAQVSSTMCEYRDGNGLDKRERWKRDCALQHLEISWKHCFLLC